MGSFATKLEGGIVGAIPRIVMLMSWIPTIIAFISAIVLIFYPLNQKKMDEITNELANRRSTEA